ncbi:hypothetical protein FQR65_LT01174 [Abscondita terminalis]|nr:hypothetical protein FQR65_LT01174 [Abscondita terminalis]
MPCYGRWRKQYRLGGAEMCLIADSAPFNLNNPLEISYFIALLELGDIRISDTNLGDDKTEAAVPAPARNNIKQKQFISAAHASTILLLFNDASNGYGSEEYTQKWK